jgi:hypothetical protein
LSHFFIFGAAIVVTSSGDGILAETTAQRRPISWDFIVSSAVALFIQVHRSFIISNTLISHIEGNRVFILDKKLPVVPDYRNNLFKELGLVKGNKKAPTRNWGLLTYLGTA